MNCDRVIVMEKGVAIEFDKPQVLYNDTKIMRRKFLSMISKFRCI